MMWLELRSLSSDQQQLHLDTARLSTQLKIEVEKTKLMSNLCNKKVRTPVKLVHFVDKNCKTYPGPRAFCENFAR